MKEDSIVRQNMMDDKNYAPYCGNPISRHEEGGCDNPRTLFDGSQFKCPKCGWTSKFPEDFMARYRQKHEKVRYLVTVTRESGITFTYGVKTIGGKDNAIDKVREVRIGGDTVTFSAVASDEKSDFEIPDDEINIPSWANNIH